MTIAHVVDSLEVGGAEMLVASLCRLHRKAGHGPVVHCLFQGGSLAGPLQYDGFSVHVYGHAPGWKLALNLYRCFRRMRPDVVHCHNAMATVLGAPQARLAGVRAILSTRHGLAISDQSASGEIKFRLAMRCCDRVVAVCDKAKENLVIGAPWAGERIVTLRNGCTPAPTVAPNGEIIRKWPFTLVHVARLMWKKDQGTLLRALALAIPQIPDLGLWIVGDGPDRPALELLASELKLGDKVRFLGERNDVGRWLRLADVFVLSSISEGTPLSLLEAMEAKLPQIVTDVGGMPEIIRLSGAGRVVPRGNPDALAAAIVEYASQRALLPALGRRAQSSYERYFTADRMASDYLQLYSECLRLRGD